MGLKYFTIDFWNIGKEKTFRCDVDFADFQNNFLINNYYSFNNLFEFKKNNKVNIESLEDDFQYSEIGNVSEYGEVEPVKLNFIERKVEDEDYYKKIEKGDIIQVEENDILLSKVRPNLKKYVLIDKENAQYYYTSAFIHLKPKILNKILYYSLRTIFCNNLIAISRQGKGYPTLKEDDFLYLKFDKNIIDKLIKKQDQIVAEIEPLEKKIKQLKAQLIPPQEIINKVFAREFGFDENLFNEFGKGMTAGTQIAQEKSLRVFKTDFSELSKSKILRFSTRFHNPPTKKLMDFLDSIETLKVKDILIEPVHRGASPKYNQDGEIPIVKTGHLKNGYIEVSQEEFVDINFYKSSIRSQVKQGDILIASTGKISLGKIDLLEEEQDLVADGHISIIRINDKKYSRQFFTYFFRSVLGYFQIERDYTGATNQIELYADEIINFKIPNIPLNEQQKIVDEIKLELDKQEEIKKMIESERNKINEIIENAIK
jgi:type I restriction enzyme S subunit